MVGLSLISLRVDVSTWRLLAILKVEWRACHKSLISKHCWPLYLIVLITGNFFLLTQFMSSHGPRLLLTISWILLSKKDCFVALTLFLKTFQFFWLLKDQYVFKVLLHSSFHWLLNHFEFAFQVRSIVEASDVVVSSGLKELTKSSALMVLIAHVTSPINLNSSSLFFTMENLNESMYYLAMSIVMISSAWSKESHESERMEWLLSSLKPLQRNMRSMVELELLSESEYLVGTLLVGHKSSKLKESAIIKRSSQRWEWWGKAGS